MEQIIFVDTATSIISVDEPADFASRVQQTVTVGNGSSVLQLMAALNGYVNIPAMVAQGLPMPILKVIFV